jgi:maltose O-acetyltransferase
MSHYFFRVLSSILGGDWIPTFLRMRMLRMLGFRIGDRTNIWSRCSLLSRRVSVGRKVFINIGFFFDGANELVIEDNVSIGQFVRILTASHKMGPSWERCVPEPETGPVRIEEGCWIGSGVTILPNVTVRRGCVVGACSLVLTSTEPDGLYVGIPARSVKDLPTDLGRDLETLVCLK